MAKVQCPELSIIDQEQCVLYYKHVGACMFNENPRAIESWEDAAKRVEHQLAEPERPMDLVNHPPHYNNHASGVECITVTEWFNFNIGNAIKYLWRTDEKGDSIEQLSKAAWYIQREIERRKKIVDGGSDEA